MKYQYSGFIPENTAPIGAKQIGVYDGDGNKVGRVPLGWLRHPNAEKLYSFGLISDLHFYSAEVAWNPSEKVDYALTFFEDNNCVFCCHAGDMTQTGFFNDGDTETFVASQFDSYKEICDRHTIPVYGICGNHESYVNPIVNNLTELKSYTGIDMYYSVAYRNDLFIFLSQPRENLPMTDEALQWLYEMLEENRNKRCFIFFHPYLDSGNALDLYGNNVFSWWGEKTTAFKNLLKHYKNTVLFHGHSHNKFECQEVDETANYTENKGFRSVHIPSISRPTQIIDGIRSGYDEGSYGYIVDVYDDFVVLNGMDFINSKFVPLGTLKIDTQLVTIDAGTFTDSTGTITT